MAKKLYKNTDNKDGQKLAAKTKWAGEIAGAKKRQSSFWDDGDHVVRQYKLEERNASKAWKDKYNILYSSTETSRPSLYAQTPKVEATRRHKDRTNLKVTAATLVIESACQFALEEIDFDDIMNNIVIDYLLPGMANAWVRYTPQFAVRGEGDDAYEEVDFEGLTVDSVHWKDQLYGDANVWADMPWVGRRVYLTKKKAAKRFGDEKAAKLQYSHQKDKDVPGPDDQAVVYEIWCKEDRTVLWYSDDYPDGVIDEREDPLNLKDFFPCPRPVRAVSTTDGFIPQSLYSQYRQQAEELNEITMRIRVLTKALRVVGIYDGSSAALESVLNGRDNKMVPVENWAQFAGTGGINGSIQFVPIKDVAAVLTELYKQREICKAEIYEITGFSDIVRGVSKASETLGAQEIKNQWAGGRLKAFQKDIQRFARDIIRIMSEIMCEQFSDESLALYAGFEPPEVTPEEQQAQQQYMAQTLAAQNMPGTPPPQPPQPTMQQQQIEQFKSVVELLRKERTRAAMVGIETDSTIMPDETQERKDRMEFLGQIGAFLQQAGPMALQYPDMRGLLGAIMMFTVRTFRASRTIEKEFDEFTKKLQAAPPPQPEGEEGKGDDGGQADMQTAQIKAQSEQAKVQAETQSKQAEIQAKIQSDQAKLELERYSIDQQEQTKRQKQQQDHDYRMAEIALRDREVQVKEAELGIKRDAEEHKQIADHDNAERQDRQFSEQRADAREKPDDPA